MVADRTLRDPSKRVVHRPAAQAVREWSGAEQRLDGGLRDQLRFRTTLGHAAAARLGPIGRVHDEAQQDDGDQAQRSRDHEQAQGRPGARGHLSWSSGKHPT